MALVNKGVNVDAREVKMLAIKLREMGLDAGIKLQTVKPEVGAYMVYSGVIEFGRKDGTIKARPHIRPAVEATMPTVLALVKNQLTVALDKFVKLEKKLTVVEIANIWMRSLSVTVVTAQQNATNVGAVLYGFHRRSISAWPNPRSEGDIQAQQAAAAPAIKSAQKKAQELKKGKKK